MKKFIPSVTRILKDLGLINLDGIPLEALETKRQLGIDVHAICARMARGQEIDLSKYEGPIRDRAERFLWWMDLMKAKAIATEQRLYGKGDFPFTGQPDLVAEISGEIWLVDIKPTFHKWNRLQLAGYGTLLHSAGQTVKHRVILPLDSSKRPMAVSCCDQQDVFEWDRCLKSWWWRYRNGLIKREK